MHMQKDKRTGIGSHMERAIFVGYSEGYKAGAFTTLKVANSSSLREQSLMRDTFLVPLRANPNALIAMQTLLCMHHCWIHP